MFNSVRGYFSLEPPGRLRLLFLQAWSGQIFFHSFYIYLFFAQEIVSNERTQSPPPAPSALPGDI